MKCLIFLTILISCTIALPAHKKKENGGIFYYVPRDAPLTRGVMYLQYLNPNGANGRLENGGEVSAFASGGSISMGTHLSEPPQITDLDEEESVEEIIPSDDELPITDDELPIADDEPEQSEEQEPSPTYDDPTIVELDQPEDDEVLIPAPPPRPAVRRPSSQKPSKPTSSQIPDGTFFPINFGGTTGSAIAVANSFSTGSGGTASSTATAFGSPPSSARLRRRKITH